MNPKIEETSKNTTALWSNIKRLFQITNKIINFCLIATKPVQAYYWIQVLQHHENFDALRTFLMNITV